MRRNALTVASLLAIALLPLHVAGDVARGFDTGGPGLLTVVVIGIALVAGTLVFPATRTGHAIMAFGGLAALAMPVIHRNNGFTPEVAKAPGGEIFIWTLLALGVLGGLVMILAARGLWDLSRASRPKPHDAGS